MILHFDFSTGASGDKILGALLELNEALGTAGFAEVVRVAQALVPGAHVERTSLERGGVRATGFTVTEADAPHRHWHDIRSLIEKSSTEGTLPQDAAALALGTFDAVAHAEAAVHGCDIEHVHFHEVGAADSIIDICCSSFLFDCLKPDAVFATPLALGFGSFVCAHGEMPVPAPATARLIEGLPVYAGTHEGELTTPTGAALAHTFVSAWEPLPCIKPQAVGFGAGSRHIPHAANVVRVLAGTRASLAGLGEGGAAEATALASENGSETGDGSCVPPDPAPFDRTSSALFIEGCALLETNIDHLSPEALAFVCEELLGRGALDVWQEPITMKKGRQAVRLSVLVLASAAQVFAGYTVELTGSLGVRSSYVERVCVPRAVVEKQTRFGTVGFKTAFIATPDGNVKLQRPEYEDVARIARTQGIDFNALYGELNASEDE